MNQQCLFNEEINIPGLTYISNYISSAYEEKLLKVESLILAACGTSHYATKYIEILLRKLGCFSYIECKIASEITA